MLKMKDYCAPLLMNEDLTAESVEQTNVEDEGLLCTSTDGRGSDRATSQLTVTQYELV